MQVKLAQAYSEIDKAYNLNPNSKSVLSTLVQICIKRKDYEKAIGSCEKFIEANQNISFALNLLGTVFIAKRNYNKAEEVFQKSIEAEPNWAPPHFNLASVYLAQGRINLAIDEFEAAARANPRELKTYLVLGELYQQEKEYQKAIEMYKKAFQRSPESWYAANNLAFLLCEFSDSKKDIYRALNLAEKTQRLHPNETIIMDTLGWIHYKLRNYDQSLQLLRKSLAQNPENSITNYHVGAVLYQIGKMNEAKIHLKRAIKSNENFIGKEEAAELFERLS